MQSVVLLLLSLLTAQPVGESTEADLAQHIGLAVAESSVVMTAPFDGRLESIDVDEGDRVKADQALAHMEDDVQQAIVDAAKLRAQSTTSIEAAEHVLETAKVKKQRTDQSFSNKAATKWEVELAQLELLQAQADLKAAREQHELAGLELARQQAELARHHVTAPFDGLVVRLRLDPGSTIQRADPILSVVSLRLLEARIDLPATVYGQLKVGQVYALVAQAPVNAVVDGKLTHVEPLIDPASQTFRCTFEIENDDEKLPSGFRVHLKSLEPTAEHHDTSAQ